MVVTLNSQRSSNLGKKLFRTLCESEISSPEPGEPEPAFTRRVLAPLIRAEIEGLRGIPLKLRGDGGDSQAVPANALEIPFYPDLAVSIGGQNLWAAEVKLLRKTGRQSAIATAFGQAALYRSRYEHVAVVLIDLSPGSARSRSEFMQISEAVGVRVVVRPRIGGKILGQITQA